MTTTLKDLGERLDTLRTRREELNTELHTTTAELEQISQQMSNALAEMDAGKIAGDAGPRAAHILQARLLALLPAGVEVKTSDLAVKAGVDGSIARRVLAQMKKRGDVESRALGASGRSGAVWFRVEERTEKNGEATVGVPKEAEASTSPAATEPTPSPTPPAATEPTPSPIPPRSTAKSGGRRAHAQ